MDNSGVTKTGTKTNLGPWQQGNDTGGCDDWGSNRLPTSLTNVEDSNTTTGNNRGDRTAVDNDGGNVDASLLSIILLALKPPDHNDNSNNGDANAKDAAGKKTLVSNTTTVGNDGGNADSITSSVILEAG